MLDTTLTSTDEINAREITVQRELLRVLAQQSKTAQWTAIGIASVASLLLFGKNNDPGIFAWMAAMVALSLLRLRYFSQAPSGDNETAEKRFRAGFIAALGVAGLLWGLLPFAAGAADTYSLAIAFLVIGGIGAGATTSLAPQRHIIHVLLVPALGGLLAALLVYRPDGADYLSVTLVLYLIGMSSLHKTQHRLVHLGIDTSIRLSGTLQSLQRNQADKEQLATELQDHYQWMSHYLAITNDAEIDFDEKTARLLRLLQNALGSDGVAICKAEGENNLSLHRIGTSGPVREYVGRNHSDLLSAASKDGNAISIQRFSTNFNPVAQLFDGTAQSAVLVRLQVKGKLFGCLVVAYKRRESAPAALNAAQEELLRLSGSWLAVELTRHAANERLKENREAISKVADSVPCLIGFLDTNFEIRYANAKFTEVFGKSLDSLSGEHVADVLDPATVKLMLPFMRRALRGMPQEFELEPFNGTLHPLKNFVFKVRFTPSRRVDGSVDGFYFLAVDITDDAQERQQLKDKSSRDPLTGLRNRSYFLEQVRYESSTWTAGQGCYILLIDIDGFGRINQEFGDFHSDRLLRRIAMTMNDSVTANDFLVRLGGDEFLLVVRSERKSDAEAAARRLVDCVQDAEFHVRGETVHVGVSVGMARIDDRFGFKRAYRQAGTALQVAKQRGGSLFVLHYS